MAATQLRGSAQFLPGTIFDAQIASSAAIASSKLADGANFIKKDGSVAMTGALNMGSQLISSLASPVSSTDAASKSYVDSKVAGFQIHFVRLVATSNVALTAEQTIDGVTTSSSRVLLTGQTTASQNGIWITGSGAWTRPTDWPAAGSLPEGQYVISDNEGTARSNTKFFCTTAGTITVDTTSTGFTQDTSGTTYTSTGVINLSGTAFSLNIGQGVENDGSNNLRVKLSGASLARGTGGISIAPGTAGQIPVTNSGATDVAMVSLSGDVTMTSAGATTVNHTAGSGFVKYTDFVPNETPGGSINGSNTTFTLANTPQNSSLELYWNGLLQAPGAGNDYTISGSTITTLFTPSTGDRITAIYTK